MTKLIDVKELADVLNLSPPTVREYAKLGRIPSLRLVGEYRFDLGEVLEALRRGVKV